MSSSAFDFDAALDEVLSATPAPQPSPGGAPFDFDAALDEATKMAPEPTDVRARKLFGQDFRDRLSGLQTSEQDRLTKQASEWATKQGIDPKLIRRQVGGDSITVLVPTGEGTERVFKSSPEYAKGVDLLRKQRDDLLAEIEGSGESVPSSDRFWSGIKVTPEGRVNYLRETYGAENVLPVPGDDGDLRQVVVLPKDGKPMVLDPKGLDWGDFLDVSGEAVETVPGVAGAVIAARRGVTGAGARAIEAGADTIGSVLRQVLSAALPGEDFPQHQRGTGGDTGPLQAGGLPGGELGERALGVGANVVAGQIGSAGGELASRALNYGRPIQGILGRASMAEPVMTAAGERPAAEVAREAAELTRGTGVTLTPGQASLSERAIEFEKTLRQTAGGTGAFSEFDKRQIANSATFVDRVITDALGKDVSKEEAGERIAQAYSAHLKSLTDARSKTARELFGRVEAVAGENAIIPMTNTVAAIEDIARDMGSGITTSQTEAMVARLNRFRDKMISNSPDGTQPLFSVRDLQNSLKEVGDMAAGAKTLLPELDPSTNKVISKRLFRALQKDLDTAADTGSAGSGETFFHGSWRGEFKKHEGLAITDRSEIAEEYADQYGQGRGIVQEVRLDTSGLKVKHLDTGYLRDIDEAPGDVDPAALAKELDADVIVYPDESPRGQGHTAWRLLTKKALDALHVGPAPGITEPALEALKIARNSYRAMSREIESNRNYAIERVLQSITPPGRSSMSVEDLTNPEKIIDLAWGSRLSDSRIKATVEAIDGIDPEAGRQFKRAAVQSLLEKVEPPAVGELGTAGLPFSPAKFASTVFKNEDRLRAVAPEAAAGLVRAARIMQRQARTAGIERGSQTARRLDWFKALSLLNVAQGPTAWAEKLSGLLNARSMSRIMTDDTMSRQFMQLVDPPKWMGAAAAVRTAEQLLVNAAKEDLIFDAPTEDSEQ